MAVVLLFVGIMMLLTGLGVLRAVLYPPTVAPALKPFLEVIMSEDVFQPAPLPQSSTQANRPAQASLYVPIVRVRLVDLNVPFRVLLLFVFKLSMAAALVWLLIAIVTALVFALLGSVIGNVFSGIMAGMP